MDCAELQRILPEIIEDGRTPEQEAHLRSCHACSGLVSDLLAISREAELLRSSDEPSPKVWNSIEMVLRREGLIHRAKGDSRAPASIFPHSLSRYWNSGWLVPAAAALLVAFLVVRYERRAGPETFQQAPIARTSVLPLAPSEDQLLLEAVATRSPDMRDAYETNLRNVNSYIRDAEDQAQADPSDEEARQTLMNAYQEKAMVYEMALNRSLP
jgi:hypothetical protein